MSGFDIFLIVIAALGGSLLIWLLSGPEPSDPEYPKYGWLARLLRWLRGAGK